MRSLEEVAAYYEECQHTLVGALFGVGSDFVAVTPVELVGPSGVSRNEVAARQIRIREIQLNITAWRSPDVRAQLASRYGVPATKIRKDVRDVFDPSRRKQVAARRNAELDAKLNRYARATYERALDRLQAMPDCPQKDTLLRQVRRDLAALD